VLRRNSNYITCRVAPEPVSNSSFGGSNADFQPPAKIQCHSCGRELTALKKFCRFCGAAIQPLTPAVATTQTAAMTCPNCGGDLSVGKKFCRYCGAAIQSHFSELETSEATAMACPSCGATALVGKKFCQACGYPLVGPVPVDRRERVPPQGSTAVAAAAIETGPESVPVQDPLIAGVEHPPDPTFHRVEPGPDDAIASQLEIFQIPEVQPVAPIEQEQVSTREQFQSGSQIIQHVSAAGIARNVPRFLYWVSGGLLLAGAVALGLWTFWFSAEVRLLRAAERGDLVTPVGTSAFDYYNQMKGRGIPAQTRSKLREQVFPKLIATGDAVLQKRTEGTSMKRAEFRELANLYDFAAELAPDDPKALSRHYYTQGTLALLDGKLQDALQSITHSVDYDAHWAPAFNDLGKIYVRSNDYYHAEWSYKKALEIQPNWVFPQLNLGGVYLHRKEWALAETAYLKAADLDNTLATTWYFLGQVYEAEARTVDAISAYQKAIDLAASRPSSAFHVDTVRKRISHLQGKLTGPQR